MWGVRGNEHHPLEINFFSSYFTGRELDTDPNHVILRRYP